MSKSKYAYYAAYGKNRVAIYTNWEKLESQQRFYKGLKYKGFYLISEAIDFVANGICNDYKIVKTMQVDASMLEKNKNFTFSIDELVIK